MTLYDECIEELGDTAKIQPIENRQEIISVFAETFPIALNGRINWGDMNKKEVISSPSDVIESLKKFDEGFNPDILIIWDEATLPVVETNLFKAISCIDDITAVSFDTWLYCPTSGYVIEFYHEGEITIGSVSRLHI